MSEPQGQDAESQARIATWMRDEPGRTPPEEVNHPPDETPPTPTGESERLRVVMTDMSDRARSEARDIADERLTATPEQSRGIKNFLKRVWTHNLAREYYRQKEIAQVERQIYQSGNIFAAETTDSNDSDREKMAIIERFASEFEDEVIHHSAGEWRQRLGEHDRSEESRHRADEARTEVMNLIQQYLDMHADPNRDAVWQTEKNRLLALQFDHDEDKGVYADNLLEIAKRVEAKFGHDAALEDLDIELDIIIGEAKTNVRTEAQFNATDRIIDKLTSSRVGGAIATVVNESTIAAAVAIAVPLFGKLGSKTASSALSWLGLGAGAIVGGGVAAAKESYRLENERRQHAREMAKNKKFDSDPAKAPRRHELEKYRLETRSAQDLASGLEAILTPLESLPNLTDDQTNDLINQLAQIKARIDLSDETNIDLISYSDARAIEQERMQLDILRGQAMALLTRVHGHDTGIRERVWQAANTVCTEIRGNEIDVKDRLFAKMKSKQSAIAFARGAASAVAVGAVVQEVASAFQPSTAGVFESGHGAKGYTPLGGLRHWIEGQINPETVSAIHEVKELVGENSVIKLPDGAELTPSDDGTFSLAKDGHILAEHLSFDDDGALTPDSITSLEEKGIIANSITTTTVETKNEVTDISVRDFLKGHQTDLTHVNRELWYDQNTAGKYDFNEQKLWWSNGGGITPDGKYSFDVSHMRADWSYHGQHAANAQELIRDGKLAILLSASGDSQTEVFKIPIDANGQAIIDPQSPAAQLFKTENGHAVFIGKYAEVAQISGSSQQGDTVRILATHVGSGLKTLQTTAPTFIEQETVTTSFGIPAGGPDLPVFAPVALPITDRIPLEPIRRGENSPVEPPAPAYITYPYWREGEYTQLREDMSPRLRENPNAILEPREEIAWYFRDQERRYPGYTAELTKLLDQVTQPMGEETKAVVALAVAGHQEHANIYRTLETYAVQKRTDGSPVWDNENSDYEILLYVNYPQGSDPSLTLQEIERFVNDHPEVPVRVYTEQISNGKVEVGWYKKLAFDLGLARHQARGREDDILIIANDADMVYTSPYYLESCVDAMSSRQTPDGRPYDAMLGRFDLDPSTYADNPTFHAAMRFWQFMEATDRAKSHVVGTQGRNTILRGSTYAAIGGNRTKDFWADIEFGRLINAARDYQPNSGQGNTIGYLNRAWVMVDPRREITKFKGGELVAHTWSDFNHRDDVRGVAKNFAPENLDLEQLVTADESYNPEQGYSASPDLLLFRNRLQEEIHAIIDIFSPTKPTEYSPELTAQNQATVERAAAFLGVKVNYDPISGEIEITDTTKLRQQLKRYRDENRQATKLQGNPLYHSTDGNAPPATSHVPPESKRANRLTERWHKITDDLTAIIRDQGETAAIAAIQNQLAFRLKGKILPDQVQFSRIKEILELPRTFTTQQLNDHVETALEVFNSNVTNPNVRDQFLHYLNLGRSHLETRASDYVAPDTNPNNGSSDSTAIPPDRPVEPEVQTLRDGSPYEPIDADRLAEITTLLEGADVSLDVTHGPGRLIATALADRGLSNQAIADAIKACDQETLSTLVWRANGVHKDNVTVERHREIKHEFDQLIGRLAAPFIPAAPPEAPKDSRTPERATIDLGPVSQSTVTQMIEATLNDKPIPTETLAIISNDQKLRSLMWAWVQESRTGYEEQEVSDDPTRRTNSRRLNGLAKAYWKRLSQLCKEQDVDLDMAVMPEDSREEDELERIMTLKDAEAYFDQTLDRARYSELLQDYRDQIDVDVKAFETNNPGTPPLSNYYKALLHFTPKPENLTLDYGFLQRVRGIIQPYTQQFNGDVSTFFSTKPEVTDQDRVDAYSDMKEIVDMAITNGVSAHNPPKNHPDGAKTPSNEDYTSYYSIPHPPSALELPTPEEDKDQPLETERPTYDRYGNS